MEFTVLADHFRSAILAFGDSVVKAVVVIVLVVAGMCPGVVGAAPKPSVISDPKIRMLVAAANDSDAKLRNQAIRSLGQTKSLEAVGPLMALAEHPDAAVRNLSITALVAIGDRRCLQTYIDALADDSEGVRGRAGQGLLALADPRSVPALVEALVHRPRYSGFMIKSVPETLVKIGDASVAELMAACHKRPYFANTYAKMLVRIGTPKALSGLKKLATDKNWRIRWIALRAADHLPKPPVEMLHSAAKDPRHVVREEAARQLGKLIKTPRAFEGLIALLDDDELKVRYVAAGALSRMNDKRLVGPFAKLLGSSNVAMRNLAAKHLASNADATVLPALADALDDPDANTRIYVLKALARAGGKEAMGHVAGALKDENLSVSSAAFGILSKAGGEGAIEALVDVLRSGSASQKAAAATRLGLLGGKAAMEGLVASLKSEPDLAARRAAAKALLRFDDPAVVSAMIKALASDSDMEVRLSACQGLGEGEPTVKALMAAAEADKAESIRLMAIRSLRGLAEPKRIVPLFGKILMSDPSVSVRQTVADYLAMPPLAGKEANGVLLSSVGKEADVVVLSRIVSSLAMSEGRENTQAIVKALPTLVDGASKSNAVLASALRAMRYLACVGAKEAIEPLIKALGNRSTSIRTGAATALGHLGDESAIAPLLAAAKESTAHVHGPAIRSLGLIGHKSAEKPLLAMLATASPGDRKRALVHALVRIDSRRHFNTYVEQLQNEAGKALVPLLQAAEKKDVIDVLLALLDHKDSRIQGLAGMELMRVGEDRAITALTRLKTDPQRSALATQVLKQLLPAAPREDRR
ncbi:MAG: HEAT repeat domain-containing protein [Phycisphaerae bacterium]|nr:HEAT repeat domain-containing protein [Phycisphaerae bacterium]